MNATRSHALTLIELLVIIAVIVVGIGIMLPALGCSRCPSRQLKDSTQVRGIVQAMVIWASNNCGTYPIPSDLDLDNNTIAAPAYTKDTTANILSAMIFNGSISPEICISPAESNNDQIRRYDNYQYSTPSGAAAPSAALWDPAFRGTPDDPITYANFSTAKFGHQSYAHLLPFGKRRSQWSDTYNSNEPVFGNRGPTYAQSDAAPSVAKVGGWTLLPGPLGTGSNTLLIHGGRKTWEGNIGHNDNHVNFETRPAPESVTLWTIGPSSPGQPGKKISAFDNFFINEIDEWEGDGASAATGRVDQGLNAYLRPIAEVASPTRPRVWRD